VIDPQDARHLIVGTDASLYESFDDGETWRQFPNLPVSQFYKLALDTAEPFYNVLGGAQDLGTLLGPSRTANAEGIRNRDWYVPLGADGYACAFDPEVPDILYMQTQRGRLQRYDRRNDEGLDIQPQPGPGEPPERWNWDAPVLVSPHSATRLYFGSQRLWRSEDRGSSWTPVSGDLTRDRNRYELEMGGRVWSVDALYDNGAMSWYGTLTAVSESPLVEGLLYVGSDDGQIQVSEDGGATWRRSEAFPDVPDLAFVNDVTASLHDPDSVFVAFDAHKTGDFHPHLLRSDDRGRSWRSIAGDLPEHEIVWAVEQDHVDPDLLFVGSEHGLYFSGDGGGHWTRLEGGVPTIAFRDIAIQRRENDLVGVTFGRGIYVLDDYSALREVAAGALANDVALFPVRDAWWYVPSVPMQARGKPSLGSDDFTAPNPPFGAIFSYYLQEDRQTAKQDRRKRERELRDSGEDVPFPGWDRLREESLEAEPKLLLVVRDGKGRVVRRLEGSAEAGIHRVSWDLRRPPPDPVDLEPPGFQPPWSGPDLGPLAPPATYTVEMAVLAAGRLERLSDPNSFTVKPVPGFSLAEPDFRVVAAFQEVTAELKRQAEGAAAELERGEERLRHLKPALIDTPRAEPGLFERLGEIEAALAGLRLRLVGDRLRGRWNEPSVPSVLRRIRQVAGGHWDTRQAPTQTQRRSLDVARSELAQLNSELVDLLETELPALEADLEAAAAPWTPGRKLPPS